MNKFLIVSILLNVARIVSCTTTSVEGYYWRDYEGTIPADALREGMDRNGRPIYIGQVLFENKLIPGKIYENGSKIYFQWGPEQSTDKNVKVLCSQNPEKIQWVATKHDQVARLTNILLVKGGYEENYFTYIGRLNAGGETTVVKVICRVTECLGIYFTNDGQGIHSTEPFEILSYNPTDKAVDRNDCTSPVSLVVSPQ